VLERRGNYHQALEEYGFRLLEARTDVDLELQIKKVRPRLVFLRAFAIPAHRVAQLANAFPQIRFLCVCHSSQTDLSRAQSWLPHQTGFLKLSQTMENVYYGTPDERVPLAAAVDNPERVLYVPNTIPAFDNPGPREAIGDLALSLVGGWRGGLKNELNQVVAAMIVAQKMECPVRLIVIGRGCDEMSLQSFTSLSPLKLEVLGELPWSQCMDAIRQRVDIGLQCSFTESFNYVAAEHLAMGRPVVGSWSIRYLSPMMQVNADDPGAIAERVIRIQHKLLTHSREAAGIADGLAKRLNDELASVVGRLMR
jgi:hypothetical protein